MLCPINSKFPSHAKSSSSPPVCDTATNNHTGETETSNCCNGFLETLLRYKDKLNSIQLYFDLYFGSRVLFAVRILVFPFSKKKKKFLGVKCRFRQLSDVELRWTDLSRNLIAAFNRLYVALEFSAATSLLWSEEVVPEVSTRCLCRSRRHVQQLDSRRSTRQRWGRGGHHVGADLRCSSSAQKDF